MHSRDMIQMYILFLIVYGQSTVLSSYLYPKESETREVKELNGIWNFLVGNENDPEIGFKEKWYTESLSKIKESIPMPVPSSYNDITQNKTIRDYVGWVWYDRDFFVSNHWGKDCRVVLRFGSAHYSARVFVNNISVVNHTGGHLPFEADVTNILKYGSSNHITVALNNTLTPETLPQGNVHNSNGKLVQTLNFDFFNYAGIHRSVVLYTTPLLYIDDITVTTDIENTNGIIRYKIASDGFELSVPPTCYVEVYDKEKKLVSHAKGCNEDMIVPKANFWWPYTMHTEPGYLYEMKVKLISSNLTDIYYLNVGIRTVKTTNTTFLINDKPFYFMGFGMHEDANIRGKGLDLPIIIKNFNLIKWIGANCFRTSHYPYAEEIMDQADSEGIVVIDECPAVGLNKFDDTLLAQHQNVLTEMINRDKNRPSVVMWSVANEPTSSKLLAESYFRNVVTFARTLDPTRPITAAISADCATDKIGQFMDILMVNRYFAWYSNPGETDVIFWSVVSDFSNFHAKYRKPIMISEYGADTISGMHMDPSFIFTEDYQTEFIMNYHQAFDALRRKGYFIGEMIWNFADFLTTQEITRVVGNKKGIFTRERQPKAAAKVIRCRYHSLVNRSILDFGAYCPSNYLCK